MLKNIMLIILGFALGVYYQGSDSKDTIVQTDLESQETSSLKTKQQRILKDETFQNAVVTMMDREQFQRKPAKEIAITEILVEENESELELPIEDFEKGLHTMTTNEKKSLMTSLKEEIT